jgi:hypothetical protein
MARNLEEILAMVAEMDEEDEEERIIGMSLEELRAEFAKEGRNLTEEAAEFRRRLQEKSK